MPATCPAYLIHSTEPVYQFGLSADLPHTFLHSIKDTATRERQTIFDENLMMAIYEGFHTPSINYAVSCHVRKQAGLQNEHPGRALNAAAIGIVVGPEAPFHFSTYDGEYIMSDCSRERTAGEFHAVNFTVLQIFPEGDAPSSIYPADIDRGLAPPLEIGTGSEGDGSVDPGTGSEALIALRIHYSFEPARGHTAPSRTGYVTRLMNRSSVPTTAEIYATHNPPDAEWQSTISGSESVISGPAWDADDTAAVPATTLIPGTYTITGIWESTTGTWITGTVEDALLWDTDGTGTNIIILTYNDGTRAIKLGLLPNLASVLTLLGLGDPTTLTRIYDAKTNTYYHGEAVPGLDEIAFWRATAIQPTAPQYFQLYEIFGQRNPITNFHFLRCTYTKFAPALAALDLPDPPPLTRFNVITTGAAYPIASVDAVYCRQDATYDLGDSTAVTALSYTAPTSGKDLWIFQYGPLSIYSGTWDYRAGNIPNMAAFWSLMGHSGSFDISTTRYTAIYHANGNSGRGRYYLGNATMGDPFATMGISLY